VSVQRLFAVGAILGLASLAWLLLGRSVGQRTVEAREVLGADVARMFGPPIEQRAPTVLAPLPDGAKEAPGRPPDASAIEVTIDHEHRSRGLVWFSVFRVAFDARYTVALPPPSGGADAPWRFRMDLPGGAAVDGLRVEVDGEAVAVDRSEIDLPLTRTGRQLEVRVRYRTSGRDRWAYEPRTRDGGLRNFRLVARTSFEEVDYPTTGLSPTARAGPRADGAPGVEAAWAYEQMLPGQNHTLGIVTPRRPDAGALSARIARFAPVSLFFFFVVMVTLQVLKGWRLHPMHYLLVAAGFFAFHILLAYLVDHLPLIGAFWIAAAVSVALVVSYLRLVIGGRRALLAAGGAQMLYLVFFSYAFFWEGWTGLTVVLGGVVTLFVVMQATGRLDWERALARARPAAEPA
jgi:hypothetical protein